MSEQNTVAPPSENEILAFTHQQRLAIHQKLAGEGIPNDDDSIRLIMQNLSSIEGVTLGRMRIKVDEVANRNQEAASELISQMLLKANADGNRPFQTERVIEGVAVPVLGNEVPPPELVEGELAPIGGVQLTYEDFVGKDSN
jgi:hypothetical protein